MTLWARFVARLLILYIFGAGSYAGLGAEGVEVLARGDALASGLRELVSNAGAADVLSACYMVTSARRKALSVNCVVIRAGLGADLAREREVVPFVALRCAQIVVGGINLLHRISIAGGKALLVGIVIIA